jgi:hypothetical protein
MQSSSKIPDHDDVAAFTSCVSASCLPSRDHFQECAEQHGAATAQHADSPLKHYTRAQKDSIAAAMKTMEQQALDLMEAKDTIQ